MRRVQQDFIDSITFRYDDETRRTMLKIYSQKETLLDADLLEEHLVNQPLLGCIILLLLFLSLTSLVFGIVFVSCRALGNCGAKRYQPHPTSSRRYGFICAIFLISWLFMAISASFFIQSSVAFWSPKVPKEFLGDHTVIRRNSSGLEQHMINKRSATSVKPMSIFDLFGDEDYQGDFEQVESTTSTTPPSFVTASVAPEDRPIPIARTHRKPLKIAKTIVVPRTTILPPQDSTESDDVPPAVDRLPIRKIDEEETTTLRPMKKFEIPARPQAELEFAKHFDNNIPVIQAPFVSDTWSRAGFSQIGASKNRKLPIQPIAPPIVVLNENDVEKVDEEIEKKEESPSTTNKPQEQTTETSTTTTTTQTSTTTTTTTTTTAPFLNDIAHDNDVVAVETSEMEAEEVASSTTDSPTTTTTQEITKTTTTPATPTSSTEPPAEEVDDDVILSSSSDVILHEGQVVTEPEVITEPDMPTPEPVFDANVEESKEEVASSGSESDVITTESTTTSTSTSTVSTEEVSSNIAVTQPTPEVIQFAISEEPEVPKENANDQADLVLSAVVTSETTEASTTETESTTEKITTPEETTSYSETTMATTEEITTPSRTEEATQTESEEEPTDDEHSPSTSIVTQMTSAEETTSATTTMEEETTPSTTEFTTAVIATTEAAEEVEEEKEEEQNVQFVPITQGSTEEEWKPVTETTRPRTTVGVFPSVPLTPDNSHGKIEQLATPLLYPFRLLHTSGVVWLSRLSLLILGGVMIVVSLPSLVLVLLGTIYYKSTQHPIDRKKTSDQIGQLIVIIATFLLFTLPLMFIFVQVTLTYNHLHNSVCPLIQLKYQQDLGILSQINSLTSESREIFMRNRVNRDNCEASQAPVETMWLSCLCFCLSSIPVLISLFKLSKYYLRMKTEYYWKLSDYGTIYAKRPAVDTAQSIYGNIYGTVGPRRPTSRPPPAPVSPEAQNYADGPIYAEGPIYGVYQAYGRF